jgi:hypothetical protein
VQVCGRQVAGRQTAEGFRSGLDFRGGVDVGNLLGVGLVGDDDSGDLIDNDWSRHLFGSPLVLMVGDVGELEESGCSKKTPPQIAHPAISPGRPDGPAQ